jgi:hypothetical protein
MSDDELYSYNYDEDFDEYYNNLEYDGYDNDDRDMEPDDCGYGSFGAPQLGTEECEFQCPLRKACIAHYKRRKDCVFPNPDGEWLHCSWFHMGSCYIDSSNRTPSRFKQLIIRLKCRLGWLPVDPRAKHYEEERSDADVIEEGHGRTDVSCVHGSRWIWWKDELVNPDGGWQNVIMCSACDCTDPPRPFKEDE